MRIAVLILGMSLAFSQSIQGQFVFQPDSVYELIFAKQFADTELAIPDFDSLQFEFRFWAFGDNAGFIQLSFDKQNNWNYRRGYFAIGPEIRILQLDTMVMVDSVWNLLVAKDVLTLPDQEKLTYSYAKDGRTILITPNKTNEPFLHFKDDWPAFMIELITVDSYRRYNYFNPEILSQAFKGGGYESPETDKFAGIVSVLTTVFKMKEIYQASSDERSKNSDKKK